MERSQDRLGGRYRLGELLGRGGTAEVYRARDETLDRDVAVKIFRSADFDEGDRERFRVEVGALVTLEHPHLLHVLDAGVDDERPWCVMQLLDGGTFSSLPKPLAPDRLARIGAEIAGALACVHERGIVHRDVKQSNILLDRDGRAYLSDFGSARIVNITGPTLTGRLIGTAAYLSPEQVEGQGATSASDVYALGLVLLEGFTGRREYPGNAIESAVARLSRPPRVPETLPGPLRALLREMTATAPQDRPNAASVAARLSSMEVDGFSPPTKTLFALPLPRRPRPSVAGHVGRQVATVVTAAVAGALVTAVVGPWRLMSEHEAHPVTPAAVATSRPAAPRATVDAVKDTSAPNASRTRSVVQVAAKQRTQTVNHRKATRKAPKEEPGPKPAGKPKPPAGPAAGPGKDQPAVAIVTVKVGFETKLP